MARRKKEEPIVHQKRIASIAEELFSKQGIGNTTMDEIAKNAGYSKATLYVYFTNKEEIVSFLTLRSMKKLKEMLEGALEGAKNSRDGFFAICMALTDYQAEYPDYFERTLTYIQIDTNEQEHSILNEAYQIGEGINQTIINYLTTGIEQGELCVSDNYFETIFHMWGMITGLIRLTKEKEEYIRLAGNLSKEEFLSNGFAKIYQTICV